MNVGTRIVPLPELGEFLVGHFLCADKKWLGQRHRDEHFIGAPALLAPRGAHRKTAGLDAPQNLILGRRDRQRNRRLADLHFGAKPYLNRLRIARARRNAATEGFISFTTDFETMRGRAEIQRYRAGTSRAPVNINRGAGRI